MSGAHNLFSTLVMPALILVGAWGFSGFVAMKVPTWNFGGIDRILGLLLLPSVATLFFLSARLLLTKIDRASALVVAWLLLFLWAMHGVLLALGIGLQLNLSLVIPGLTSLLYLLLAPILMQLPHTSIMGLRTSATLNSGETWVTVHRRFAAGIAMTGLSSLLAAGLFGPFFSLGIIAFGSILAILAALFMPRGPHKTNS